MQAFQHWDLEIFNLINQGFTHSIIDKCMLLVSSIAFWGIFAAIGIVWALVRNGSKVIIPIFSLLLSIGAADSLSFFVLKPYFGRLRPCYTIDDVRLLKDSCGGKYGFPSNHAANGAAVVTALIPWLATRVQPYLWFLVLLVGMSRIYIGVHYPADVVMGIAVGILMGLIVTQLTRPLRRTLF